MNDFPHVITEIYRSTPLKDHGLCDIVITIAHEHINKLLKKNDFRDSLREIVGFAADITKLLVKEAKTQQFNMKRYRCLSCSNK